MTLLAHTPDPRPLLEGTTIEVTNARGFVVFTSDNPKSARKWARAKAPLLGDLTIDAVTVSVSRKRVTTVRRKAPKLELVPASKTENREVMA